MTRIIIRFKDGEHINLSADCLDIRDGWIIAWRGEDIVVIADSKDISVAYLSEKKE